MANNRSMPPGTVIPEVPYPDVNQAAEWLARAFGFAQRLRIGNHRVQLTIGEGSIIATARAGNSPPHSSIMVHVADVDDKDRLASQHGARSLNPPADYPYGERQYTARDLAGHTWTFSQTIADIDPADWGAVLP